MASFNAPALHAGTPRLAVLCVRGLPVREVDSYRNDAADIVELHITRHRHDTRGNLAQSLDPRLAETAIPNFRWHSDLAGRTLYTESVDAGSSVALPDVAGRPLLAVSATGVSQACFHEAPSLPGRLLVVTEQGAGEALPRVAERYRWAGLSPAEKNRNLAGQCVRHYDTAGLIELQNVALSGSALAQIRRVLVGEDEADWAGDDEQAWQTTLEPERYVTLRTLDATGVQLTLTDARGHQQRQAYDVAGQLQGSWLTLQGQAEQVIVASQRYTPAGHKQQEVHGNGMVTYYALDPMTQRLTGIRVQRSGIRTLQDLHYRYDPVGNVQSVRNDAEAIRFWRNQKVTAESTFTYDSLYQLVQATGREMVGRGAQGPQLPDVLVPLPTDESALTNYTRRYSYDRAGNLTQIQHSAPASNNAYTTRMTVSNRSNRAVLAREGLLPEQVDELFDAGGHQLELLAGQDLRWNARGELAQVKPIEREAGVDDREWYRYGSDGMRLLKVSEQQAVNLIQAQRVLYLDGLELRDTHETSRLHVIKVAAGGGAEVRVLHWASGLPEGQDNDQVRYSYHNLIGSSGLELDGQGAVISREEYYPFGGTSVWAARSQIEAEYKILRYSGKERDATGLYYYGYRYYQPWAGRWLSADPAGTTDGLNVFRMVRNNPQTYHDPKGSNSREGFIFTFFEEGDALYQIIGENYSRQLKGKPLRPVIARDDKAKAKLESAVHAEKLKLSNKLSEIWASYRVALARQKMSWADLKARLPRKYSDFKAVREIIITRYRVLGGIEIQSNENGRALAALESQRSKLYIIGHALAGENIVTASASGAGGVLDTIQIAQLLVEGGLPKDFQDIRVAGCGSADAIPAASFDPAVLEGAATPVIDTSKFYLGMSWEQIPGKKPVALSLAEGMRANGYMQMGVTGYHGDGLREGREGHHLRIIGDAGDQRRRSLVSRRF
ncbi:RHS repeat domain-containing protein [Pseudomonas sp. CC120222-01a]|uniref:RHS repeat domain-containing protein n=1 Tax=Pseudomonas sp. CC120222-01a TaxID=1378075 RepID=UPI000DE65693|nr:RHS repeat domain-containing protein [Pseudomonas sp. CC120222-01a]PVZ43783.1 RHS repeat-associated protein [Pseudomonas sp. CC120222-01a]